MIAKGPERGPAPRDGEGPRLFRYALEAEREVVDSGMAADELRGVLNGEAITTLVPPRQTEDVVAYGVRATGEILVRYLVDGPTIPTRMD